MVVYKSQQPAKFAASLQGFASYFKSQDMARRSKLRLNKNINL